jgi:hypothetical protein
MVARYIYVSHINVGINIVAYIPARVEGAARCQNRPVRASPYSIVGCFSVKVRMPILGVEHICFAGRLNVPPTACAPVAVGSTVSWIVEGDADPEEASVIIAEVQLHLSNPFLQLRCDNGVAST